MPQCVVEAISNHLHLESMCGAYEAAALVKERILRFYQAAAELIHAESSEIAFIESATRAWDMAFYSLNFTKGDKILTSRSEYASNYLAFLQMVKRVGVIIKVVSNEEDGQLSVRDLENQMDDRVKLISVTHVPMHNGLINPVEEVGQIAKKHGVFYLLDATQSIGQMPIDVKKIGCDALCATGRKYLRGPRGTGFLYVSRHALNHLEPPFIDMHAAKWVAKNEFLIASTAQRFETWETSEMNKLGITTAIDYALSWGIENIWARIQHLSKSLRHRLSQMKRIVLEDQGREKCGIVSFIVEGMEAKKIKLELLQKNIHVSVPSIEHARLDLEPRNISSIIRSSVHYYNTEEEIDRFCHELGKMIQFSKSE